MIYLVDYWMYFLIATFIFFFAAIWFYSTIHYIGHKSKIITIICSIIFVLLAIITSSIIILKVTLFSNNIIFW